MKHSKNNKFDFAGLFLILVQCINFIIIAMIALTTMKTPIYVISLIATNLLLTIILNRYTDYQNKKGWKDYSKKIKEAVETVESDRDFDVRELGYDEDVVEIFNSIKNLHENIKKREVDRTKTLNMINNATSNMEIEKLFEDLMPKLIESLNSSWGAFYLANNATNKLELKSALGFNKNIYNEFDLTIGEGLVGLAAKSKETTVLRDIQDDTIFVTKTFLGKVSPKNIMLVPVINNEQLIGVLCLASVYEYTDEQMEIVDMIKYYLGIALGNCVIYERSRRLTNELQFQNSLIQSLNEELETKVSDKNLFLKGILDSIKDYSIYVVDEKGIIAEWNKGSELLFGYSEDEVKGKHINVLYSDEEVSTGRVKNKMTMVTQYGQFTEHGWRYKKGGKKYYAETSLFGLYNDNDELIGITSVTRDITQLKISENELWLKKDVTKKLIETSERALIVTDQKFEMQYCSELALDKLGIKEETGKSIWDFIDGKEILEHMEKNPNDRNFGAKTNIKSSNRLINVRVNSIKDDLSSTRNYVFNFYYDADADDDIVKVAK